MSLSSDSEQFDSDVYISGFPAIEGKAFGHTPTPFNLWAFLTKAFHTNQKIMPTPSPWQTRWNKAVSHMVDLCLTLVVYLSSELLIWGLSRALAPVGIQFFSSIIGMLLVFAIMTITYLLWKKADDIYQRWLQSKVNFINSHLGVAFPVPIVMLDHDQLLSGKDIARIIGAFVTTNLISWVMTFAISALLLAGVGVVRNPKSRQHACFHLQGRLLHQMSPATAEAQSQIQDPTNPTYHDTLINQPLGSYSNPRVAPLLMPLVLSDQARRSSPYFNLFCKYLTSTYAVLLSFSFVFLVGVPVTILKNDQRLLDGCAIWFFWIASVKLQRAFKNGKFRKCAAQLKNTISTMMNPVLVTTLLMMAYTRAKALLVEHGNLTRVLKTFSGGTPIYALLTAVVQKRQLPNNPNNWFGAGDAALSLLECGMCIWGFKLFECRRQLWSISGILIIFICTVAAAANVFSCVLVSNWIGLEMPEALAFAARSTTLALAKPAIEAMGGNAVVNATLVVSNGILGQLMYPFALDVLGVEKQEAVPTSDGIPILVGGQSEVVAEAEDGRSRTDPEQTAIPKPETSLTPKIDTAITIAAGIAIGINGAAMGVSYLYETKSRAAPYAALSMAVFGVMTVVFTTLEPFTSVLIGLASR